MVIYPLYQVAAVSCMVINNLLIADTVEAYESGELAKLLGVTMQQKDYL